MRFSSKEDIEAPIDAVFAAATDFEGFERQAMRRGAEVSRTDTLGAVGVGAEWNASFVFRGKERKLKAKITGFDVPNGYEAKTRVGGLEGDVAVELLALSPGRTRLQVSLELQPQTLSARLLVQSLKFAKGNLNRRFATRMASFAAMIEDKARGAA